MKDKIKHTVLCFVVDEAKKTLLMIHKKRGQGAGKWNVPGGKIQAGESAMAAAIRETEEETGLTPSALQETGKLEFYFPHGGSWDNLCTVFVARAHTGTLIPSNAECDATWISLHEIPYEEMWESDQRWAPLVFSGKFFHRIYSFDENDHFLDEKIVK